MRIGLKVVLDQVSLFFTISGENLFKWTFGAFFANCFLEKNLHSTYPIHQSLLSRVHDLLLHQDFAIQFFPSNKVPSTKLELFKKKNKAKLLHISWMVLCFIFFRSCRNYYKKRSTMEPRKDSSELTRSGRELRAFFWKTKPKQRVKGEERN